MVKTANLKLSDETHRKLRLLAADRDLTAGELVSALIEKEWDAAGGNPIDRPKKIAKGEK